MKRPLADRRLCPAGSAAQILYKYGNDRRPKLLLDWRVFRCVCALNVARVRACGFVRVTRTDILAWTCVQRFCEQRSPIYPGDRSASRSSSSRRRSLRQYWNWMAMDWWILIGSRFFSYLFRASCVMADAVPSSRCLLVGVCLPWGSSIKVERRHG